MRKVSQELGIFWNSPEGQTEAIGIEFYGLFLDPHARATVDPRRFGWEAPRFDAQAHRIETDKILVLCITVQVNQWPDDKTWSDQVRATLAGLVANGALVAWAGGYDCNWAPEVLNPEECAGNVYAAYSRATGFLCNAQLSEEMRFLDDDQLRALWRVVESA